MGWWGEDILDGDTPMDCVSVVFQACGIDYCEWMDEHGSSLELPPRVFQRNRDAAFEAIGSIYCDDALDRSACMGVFGLFALLNEAKLTATQRNAVHDSVLTEIENVEHMGWCSPDSRHRRLTSFLADFNRAYPQPATRRFVPEDLRDDDEEEEFNGWHHRGRPARRASRIAAPSAATGSRYTWKRFENVTKFWEVRLVSRGAPGIQTRWGRIGTKGNGKTKRIPADQMGSKVYDGLVQSKIRKGYRAV